MSVVAVRGTTAKEIVKEPTKDVDDVVISENEIKSEISEPSWVVETDVVTSILDLWMLDEGKNVRNIVEN